MKRKLKVIAAILLVLIMFISAMPMQLTAEIMTPPATRYMILQIPKLTD